MRRPDATLDSTKNNCWMVVTDGEELKNNQIYSVARSSVAVIFGALKGKPLTRWLGGIPLAQNLRTIRGR